MTTTTTRPDCIAAGLPDLGVYVACLASYNGGILYGAWIDLEGADLDDINAGIAWILSFSPEASAEEWAVHDSSGLPGYLTRTEWPDLSDLIEWAEAVSAYNDDDDREAFRLACEDQGQTISEDDFRDMYQGCHQSEEDYAQGLAEDITETQTQTLSSTWPTSCIDWERAWRELTFDGYRSERCSSGGVHIFRPV